MKEESMTDEEIVHLWDTHVNSPTAKYPLTEGDKIAFARAILAAQSKQAAPIEQITPENTAGVPVCPDCGVEMEPGEPFFHFKDCPRGAQPNVAEPEKSLSQTFKDALRCAQGQLKGQS
jgi:hypothetical protein